MKRALVLFTLLVGFFSNVPAVFACSLGEEPPLFLDAEWFSANLVVLGSLREIDDAGNNAIFDVLLMYEE